MAGFGYELKENEAESPDQILDWGNRPDQSSAPPYAGNYAEGAKSQYKMPSATLNHIQADVNQIARAIRSRSDSPYWQTLIVSLIEGWKKQDSRLSGSMGSPHLDKGLELLETERYSNTSIGGEVLQENNGIEQLYYLLNPGKRLTFLEQLKSSEVHKHYAEYMKPEITNSFLHHEIRTAQEISQCIKRGDITGADSLLSKSSFYNIDDVALGVSKFLNDRELKAFISHSPNARKLAVKLIDELSAGIYAEDERRHVERLKQAYSKWFLGRSDPKREEGMLKSLEKWTRSIAGEEDPRDKWEPGDVFIIPIGSAGFGRGDSTVQASLGNDGKIYVRVLIRSAHSEYQNQLPYYIVTNGIWLDPNQPVMLEFVDPETARKFQRSKVLVPASFLLEISNEGTTEVVQKLLAWGLAGFLAPFMAVPAIGVAGVEGSSAAMVAVVLATEAIGAFSLTLNAVRNDLIILYGDDARKFFKVLDVVDVAVGLYGLGTLLYHAPSILKGLRDFPSKLLKEKAARKNAWLTPEAIAKVNKDLERLERAEQEVSKIKEAVGGRWDPFKGKYENWPKRVPAPRPPGPWLERVSETSSTGGMEAAMSSPLPGSGQPPSAPRLEAGAMHAPSEGQQLARPPLPSGSWGAPPKPTGPAVLTQKGATESLTFFPMKPASESAPPPSLRTLAEDTEKSATVTPPFGNKPTPDWVPDPAFIPPGRGAGPSGSGSAEARLELPVPLPSKTASGGIVAEGEGWHFASSGNSGATTASEVKASVGGQVETVTVDMSSESGAVPGVEGAQKKSDLITPGQVPKDEKVTEAIALSTDPGNVSLAGKNPKWYPMHNITETSGSGAIQRIHVSQMDEDGALEVIIRQRVGKPIRRSDAPNFNQILVRGSDIGLPEYRLAHLAGPGFSDEAMAGLWLAHDSINGALQNLVIEAYVRRLSKIVRKETKQSGQLYEVFADLRARRFARSALPRQYRAHDFLEHVEYSIYLLRDSRWKQPIGNISFSVNPPPNGRLIERSLEIVPDPKYGYYLTDLFERAK